MKKGLIITDYWEKSWIWNHVIDMYLTLREGLEIDLLNLHNLKWFFHKPTQGNILEIGNYYTWVIFWKTWRLLSDYLNRNRYDYIILWHQWMCYLIPFLKKMNLEVITVVHDMMSYNTYKYSFLHFIFRKISTSKIIQSDKLVFISENTRKDFYDLWLNFSWKTSVINSYIDDEKFYKLDSLDYVYAKYNLNKSYKKIFISVTNWQHHKNDITFFRLANEYKNYLFIKVWNISKECKKYIKTHHINNIQFLSWLNYEQLRELYNISDIYINTSTKEGFWYPPFEALFCSCKLLTTKSINITKEDWIYIVDDFFDIDKYKKWIETLLHQNLEFKNISKYIKWEYKDNFERFI